MRVTRVLVCAVAIVGCRAEEPGSSGDAGSSVDAGDPEGADAGPEIGCDPFVPRAQAPEVFVAPVGLEQRMVAEVDSATSRVWVLIYQFDSDPVVAALGRAHGRGVDVRVMFDGEQSVNGSARSALSAAGVQVRDAPTRFEHNHAKLLLIDDHAVIMSANLNYWSFEQERNYGVIDRDPEDVADLEAIYEADWSGTGVVSLPCTRLVVSPINARQRLLSLVNAATTQLDLEVMYISDTQIRNAVKQRASAGVTTRVILANPGWIDGNAATATELTQAGAQVKFLYDPSVHSKLVIADGVAFIGSENFSWTSLESNRETGIFVTEPASASVAIGQFTSDWAIAQSP